MTLALVALCGVLSAAPAKPLFPYPVKTTVLKNGLSVTRVPFNSPGLVAYFSVVRVGSRNEIEPGHTGFAHFFEHVMFKGTKNWPEGTRDALLGKMGFSENAFTSDDVTVYYVNGPSSGLAKLIELEADRFRNLEYNEATFQTEAKAVLGEYHKNAANPALKIEETILSTAFTRHPYRHTTLGFYEDVQAMPTRYEYSKEFFKRWYTPDNTMLFIVGEFDDAKAMTLVETHYGSWDRKSASIVVPAEPPQDAARTATVTWTNQTLPRHGLYWHTPAASVKTSDAAIQQVLSSYLAGPTSPLYKSLVLEKQLVESLNGDFMDHRDPNLFGITATLKEETHRAAVNAALEATVAEIATGK
ncbi:MAG: Peptidase, (Pitrilysin) family, partial [Myxococcaceae bacterium]|nr:Peptidase, (Pitrilysin) family [Myxococcaceae bacterium]